FGAEFITERAAQHAMAAFLHAEEVAPTDQAGTVQCSQRQIELFGNRQTKAEATAAEVSDQMALRAIAQMPGGQFARAELKLHLVIRQINLGRARAEQAKTQGRVLKARADDIE